MSNFTAMTFEQACAYADAQGSIKGDAETTLWNLCYQIYLASLKGTFGKSSVRDIYMSYLKAQKRQAGKMLTADQIAALEKDSNVTSQVSKCGVFSDMGKVSGAQPDYLDHARGQVERIISANSWGTVKTFEGTLKIVREQRDTEKASPNDYLSDEQVTKLLTPKVTVKEEGKEWQKIVKAAEKTGATFGTPDEELKAILLAIQVRQAQITLALTALAKAKAEEALANVKQAPIAAIVKGKGK